MLKHYHAKHILVLVCFVVLSFFSGSEAEGGSVWLSIGNSKAISPASGIFETKLRYTSWDAIMSAYLINVKYDPTILQILKITTPSQSRFYENTFADQNTFASGSVDIAGFTTEGGPDQDVPEVFAKIRWKFLGTNSSLTTIKLEPKSIIDFGWRSVDVTNAELSIKVGIDTDGDGLPDDIENQTCPNLFDADSDDDGISDGVEDANLNGIVDSGETDPCNPDTDGDGILDGTEMGVTLNDVSQDTNLDIFKPDSDPSTTTDPLNPDTDSDGLLDGEEDINHNGMVDPGETNPDRRNVKALPWLLILMDE